MHILLVAAGLALAAAAQPAFVRGVVLLHNFEYDEAIVAFREAERADPTFAMAYWGEAMCYSQPLWYNENVAKAREALARLAPTAAERAKLASTPRERGYLAAVEALFADGVDRASRQRAYADRMGALYRAFPVDDDVAAFYALALLATIPEGERRPEISLQAGQIASAVLARNPRHPGAAHYALHAYDDGVNNRLGLQAARLYVKMAPASSHARHMPSHVFLPLGLWNEAAAADEASWAASVAWVKATGRTLAQQDFHSLSWLHYEYLQQGRFAEARALMEPVERALKETGSAGETHPAEHVHSEIGRGYSPTALRNELASMRARDVIESGEWTRMQGQGTFDNVDELFALGLSSINLGDLARADAAAEHLTAAASSIPDRDSDQREVIAIMAAQLTGLLQIARGDQTTGLATLAKTAEAESRRPPPIARPYPIKPAEELYAEALLAAGKPAQAATHFNRALARTPGRALSLAGLSRARISG
jgi:tetratricopeptide (TPR) repeat protein